tara:strand:- start:1042 stop:1212 length:171 start_codon:yes stop_codon:yes gene_type:complete
VKIYSNIYNCSDINIDKLNKNYKKYVNSIDHSLLDLYSLPLFEVINNNLFLFYIYE